MTTQIEPRHAALVIEGALAIARASHDAPAVAAASLSGLSLVRQAVSEHAGYAALRQYDDWLGEQLASRRRRHMRTGDAQGVALPEPATTPWRPVQIMREAVQSCFLLNGHADGNSLLLVASESLLDGVISSVGGFPDTDALLAALDAGPERDDDATAPLRPVTLQ